MTSLILPRGARRLSAGVAPRAFGLGLLLAARLFYSARDIHSSILERTGASLEGQPAEIQLLTCGYTAECTVRKCVTG